MRIRSIKPEFWTSDDITELAIEDAYSGPPVRPAEFDRLLPSNYCTRYVYAFFHDDSLLYVGKAWNVRARVEKHRRKKWWPTVNHVEVMRVIGSDNYDADQREALLENAVIAATRPIKNIVGPSDLPGRRLWNVGTNPHDQA